MSFLGIGLTGQPVAAARSSSRRDGSSRYPLYLWLPSRVIAVSGARPQPAGRLDPRRVRPQDSPVTTVHACGRNNGKVASNAKDNCRDPRWLSAAGALALSACGGDGDDDDDGDSRRRARRHQRTRQHAATAADPTRRARARSRAPRRAAPSGPVSTSRRSRPCDPSETSTTPTRYAIGQRSDLPVADPVRLRRTRASRSWCPTWPPTSARPTRTSPVDVHAARRHQVRGRHAGHRRGRRVRHRALDGQHDVPRAAGPSTSIEFFEGGDEYKGPYTDPAARARTRSRVETADDITDPHGQAVPGHARTTRRSRPTGPIPKATGHDPANVRQRPLSTGPYKIEEYTPGKKLKLVRNDQWDPATDPARTQYPDGYEFEFAVTNEQIDQILLNDQGDGREHADLRRHPGRQDYRKFQTRPVAWSSGPSPCTGYCALDTRKITDQGPPRRSPGPTRTTTAIGRRRPDPGRQRGPGPAPHAARLPGPRGVRPGRAATGRGRPTRQRPRQILEDSRQRSATSSSSCSPPTTPTASTRKDAIVKGLEEAGFKATPDRRTDVENCTTDRDDPNAPVNMRLRPAGARTGRRVRSWFPVLLPVRGRRLGLGNNYRLFEDKSVDARDRRDPAPCRSRSRLKEWDELDKEIMRRTSRSPAVLRRGRVPGSVTDHRSRDQRPDAGHARRSRDICLKQPLIGQCPRYWPSSAPS